MTDMATKKFIIEVEEGKTKCDWCPLQTTIGNCCGGIGELDCFAYNFATMKITEMEEEK